MPLSGGIVELDELLTLLTQQSPNQQLRLDEEYSESITAFRPVFEEARAAGYESLARAVTPFSMVIAETNMRVEVHLAGSSGREFGLRVRPLNLAYERKFVHSGLGRSNLEVTVKRVPFPPGQAPGEGVSEQLVEKENRDGRTD